MLPGRHGARLEGHEFEDEGRWSDAGQSAQPVPGGEGGRLARQAAEEEARSRHTRREGSPGADAADAPAQTRGHKLWKTVRLQLN